MKIVCIGWGSLIWEPKNLLIRRKWFSDGPFLPIEFTRQSLDGRLTLVITPTAKPVRTLWASMATEDIYISKESLRVREGIPENKANQYIDTISANEETNDPIGLTIQDWLRTLRIDAAIWTNLPSKFNNEDKRVPTIEEAIVYLEGLDINKRKLAEEYVRKAPKQIDTDYRREFEKQFRWSSLK
jgi:hypothetical protein